MKGLIRLLALIYKQFNAAALFYVKTKIAKSK